MSRVNAAELFKDLREHSEKYNKAPLTQVETDALVAMLYNLNSATTTKLHLNAENYHE